MSATDEQIKALEEALAKGPDTRPENCRHRLQEEGKSYPRSSCTACGATIMTGLGRKCAHELTVNLAPALIARLRAAEAERDEAREALAWYGEQARLCRIIHKEGDAGRHALDADGGKRAHSILSRIEKERP